MRSLSLIQFKKRSVGLMWLMLGVYVWLSSVVQLDHSDDVRAVITQSALSMALAAPTHQSPAATRVFGKLERAAHVAPVQPCAACEWVASVHIASTPSLEFVHLPVGYEMARAQQFESALLQRDNRLVTLRGPPAAA